MRKVQRLAAGLLALSLSIACAQAEILTIDIDQASYEEINTVYQLSLIHISEPTRPY